jgi:hypothetical protein
VLSPSCGARATRMHLIVVHPQFRLSPPKGGNKTTFVLRYVYANRSKCPGDWTMTGLFLKAGSSAQRYAISRLSTWFGGLIWGRGPSFSFATASDRSLGTGKNSAGLSTALLTIKGPWLVSGQLSHHHRGLENYFGEQVDRASGRRWRQDFAHWPPSSECLRSSVRRCCPAPPGGHLDASASGSVAVPEVMLPQLRDKDLAASGAA